MLALIAADSAVPGYQSAQANHILFKEEEPVECEKTKALITALPKDQQFDAFTSYAKSLSKCPSGSNGGDLGEFGPHQMVAAFDSVVFASGKLQEVEGCVKTQFGQHLIWIRKRVYADGTDEPLP
eukprot:CAMPEP_0113666052 /NCGR_PEP_ID=MMETSP0038_2-20120614/2652_1 /TAXON_ID=2898 /ORGANISM="Cryptomonas paramecium" /LENGTH=124 /DNA_ID=CAMNT_0000581485 /DNA_START=56 /DNA_END=430 /DNA_ORIENTATION=+ /assembly_acc=CAM_ASM_000170